MREVAAKANRNLGLSETVSAARRLKDAESSDSLPALAAHASASKGASGMAWIVFDDGRVAFLAPKNYATHREHEETVAVYPPGKASGVTLRFSLHTRPLDLALPSDVAEQYVIDRATEQHLPLTRLRERVFLTERKEVNEPGRRVLVHYWQIGAGRILVVASATILGENRESDTVQSALRTVPKMIESLRLI